MLRVLLGTCQLVETQDQWDQKVQHTLQRRNFVVAVQLFEDRTAESREWKGYSPSSLRTEAKISLRIVGWKLVWQWGSWHLHIQF